MFLCFLPTATQSVVVVSDVRRVGDMDYIVTFCASKNIQLIRVRINVPDEVRTERGWSFAAGVDDAPSECELDNYDKWEIILDNKTGTEAHETLEPVFNAIKAGLQRKASIL